MHRTCQTVLPINAFLRRMRCRNGNAGTGRRHCSCIGKPMNHLRFLGYVDEVARAGSIRQAAERLHVAPSAVNRRVELLVR